MRGAHKFILALLLAGGSCAWADRDSPFPDRGDAYLTFYLENDLFAGTDRNYTNGARLSWVSGARPVSALGSVQRLLRGFSGDEDSFHIVQLLTGFDAPDAVEYNYGFSLTQLMFTPEDDRFPGQPAGERPYAAWTGIGFSLHAMDANVLNSAELTLGVIGPHALGEETQDFVHDLKGVPKFAGWDAQIPDEITLNYYFVQKRRIDLKIRELKTGAFRASALWDWGMAVGNFRTHAETGAFFRAGWN
ncbi:MAG: lipid A deacylase LpxR family protein, partial [Akkermansiaceae bacterium]|nr:lipid A deacylase LpxR family protein [Akkermansiaceae bacterium]